MTATVLELPPVLGVDDKHRAVLDLAQHFVDLPPLLDGRPGTEAANAALLDGYVEAAAVIWNPLCTDKRPVFEAFVNLVDAVAEQTAFENCPADWMDAHGLRPSLADVKACELQREVDHWTEAVAEAVR